jgi:hypothetical protein
MRSTKVETELRIEQVYKLLLGGATFPDIREFARAPEQAWTVTDAQLRRYMTVAHRRMRARFEARADYSFSQQMLRREQLYAHAMGAGDFRTALAVLQDQAKLEGLYPPTKTELTGRDGGPLQFSLEDAVAADRELEEAERDRDRRGGGEALPDGSPQVP